MSSQRKIGVVLLALVVLGGFFIWQNSQEFDPSIDPDTLTDAKEYENYYTNLKKLYENDTYGGATPEETIALFIDALEKGDIELASKYYLPENQKEKLKELQTGGGSSSLFILDFLENQGKGKFVDSNRFYLPILDSKGTFLFDIIFSLNKFTKIWKIESL